MASCGGHVQLPVLSSSRVLLEPSLHASGSAAAAPPDQACVLCLSRPAGAPPGAELPGPPQQPECLGPQGGLGAALGGPAPMGAWACPRHACTAGQQTAGSGALPACTSHREQLQHLRPTCAAACPPLPHSAAKSVMDVLSYFCLLQVRVGTMASMLGSFFHEAINATSYL